MADVITTEFLAAARLVAATPNALWYGVDEFMTLADKAVAQAVAMARASLVNMDQGRYIDRMVRRLVEGNGGVWTAAAQESVLVFDAAVRDGRLSAEQDEWIRAHVVPPNRRVKRRTTRRRRARELFDPVRVLFLAGPLSGLEDHQPIGHLRDRVELAVDDVGAVMGRRGEMQVECPSSIVSSTRAQARVVWNRNRQVLLEQTVGLIITDLALRAAGFGAGCELRLMAAQGGPVLLLHHVDCPSESRYLLAHDEELDLTRATYHDDAHAAEIVRNWLSSCRNAFDEADCRRADLNYALSRSMEHRQRAWAALDDQQQRRVAAVSGMVSEAHVARHLASPSLYDTLSGTRRSALEELLDDPRARCTSSADVALLDFDALLVAAEEEGWSATRIRMLWTSAAEAHAGPGGVLPMSGGSGPDWCMAWARRLRP